MLVQGGSWLVSRRFKYRDILYVFSFLSSFFVNSTSAGPIYNNSSVSMRNPTCTCLSLLLIFLLEWPLFTSSAPTPPSGAGSSSSTSHNVDLRVHRFFDIDPTCNAQRGVERGLSDIFELAEVAQHISEDSVACVDSSIPTDFVNLNPLETLTYRYQHYFLSRKQDPHELDIVRNMAKSILVNGNSNKKTTIKCSAMDTDQGA